MEITKKLLICGLDLETTGLDWKTDYITELGYIVKYAGAKKPAIVRSRLLQVPAGCVISPEIEAITGITNAHLDEWGDDPDAAFDRFLNDTRNVDLFVAHNGTSFDRPFLLHHLRQLCCLDDVADAVAGEHPIVDPKKWLDTKEDIEYPRSKSTHLGYLAADHGFLNPFPHSAIFDTATMLRIFESYPLEEIIARAATPNVVVRACIGFADNALAKARRYRWQEAGNGKTYVKQWVKLLKADKVAKEIDEAKAAGFDVVVIE